MPDYLRGTKSADKTRSSALIIAALLIFIIMTVLATVLISKYNSTGNKTGKEEATNPSSTQNLKDRIKRPELGDLSNNFKISVQKIKIDDGLVDQLRKKPSFGFEVGNEFSKRVPNFSTMSAGMVKSQYQTFLIKLTNTNVHEVKYSNMQKANDRLLSQLLYMATIADSQYVSTANKVYWVRAIKDGKALVSSLSGFATDQKEELKKFNDDFFKRKIFVDLGI